MSVFYYHSRSSMVRTGEGCWRLEGYEAGMRVCRCFCDAAVACVIPEWKSLSYLLATTS